MFPFFSLSASGQSLWERIVVWYNGSFLHELITYLHETYFSVDFGAYDHISLGPGAAQTVQTVIFSLTAAIILVAIATYYHRVYLGRVVRRLLREEANSPEKAKTLMELGYFRSAFIRRELAHGTALRKLIRCTEEEEYARAKAEIAAAEPSDDPTDVEKTHHVSARALTASPYRMNFLTARFYIPEDLRHRAAVRYEWKGSGLVALILVVLGAILFAALACYALPDLLQLIDNIINLTSPA